MIIEKFKNEIETLILISKSTDVAAETASKLLALDATTHNIDKIINFNKEYTRNR